MWFAPIGLELRLKLNIPIKIIIKNNKAVVISHCFKKLIREITSNKTKIINKNIKLILTNLPKTVPIIYKNKIIAKGLIVLYLLFEDIFFIGHKLAL